VHVRVDHAGENGHRAEVDHARSVRDLEVRADVGDAIAFDQNHLIVEQVARTRIEQMPCSDRDDLLR
jgi:hypothetical protein